MAPSDSHTAGRARANRPAGQVAHDPAIQEMVKRGILKARDKLIDLTMRNGMLQFRHSETSVRHLRIVDQDLEFLVKTLASGHSLDVVPVPPVEQIPRDEDTDAFRAALKEAKVVDPEWLAAEDARRAAGNRRSIRDKAAERALRNCVRAQLGMPEWLAAIDPKAQAKELGINPSYDLPTKATRRDEKLQTLFFPDRLEPKLSALHSATRALQEDAGISALHCAVGFLEWFEAEDSPDPAFAPLVLLPVNMEKRIANDEYTFSIAGRDDDETANVALREKLKRHALELPEYDPEAGIEPYPQERRRRPDEPSAMARAPLGDHRPVFFRPSGGRALPRKGRALFAPLTEPLSRLGPSGDDPFCNPMLRSDPDQRGPASISSVGRKAVMPHWPPTKYSIMDIPRMTNAQTDRQL